MITWGWISDGTGGCALGADTCGVSGGPEIAVNTWVKSYFRLSNLLFGIDCHNRSAAPLLPSESVVRLHVLTAHQLVRRAFLLVPILVALAAGNTGAESSRDQLRALVQNCLDPKRAGDATNCPAPVGDSDVADKARCKTTTQVWEKSTEFVAVRDLKMCGCPRWFEHGIAMPFALISGVESEDLPEGIWQFAWDAARKRFNDPNTIALVVNSRLQRSQDQLHVHIVGLLEGARGRFPQGYSVNLANLDHVWAEARTLAREKNMLDYGVVVVQGPAETFTLLVTDGDWSHSPEKQYTLYRCQ
jgi:CDP-diacylglycerol pyrophosphatase